MYFLRERITTLEGAGWGAISAFSSLLAEFWAASWAGTIGSAISTGVKVICGLKNAGGFNHAIEKKIKRNIEKKKRKGGTAQSW